MQVGQKVVCVDDNFPGPLARHYINLPVEGKTYTVRAVYVARAVMYASTPGAADGEIGLLLQELKNPPDPRQIHHNELGFKSDRFRPLDTLPDEHTEQSSDEERELVNVVPHEHHPSTSTASVNRRTV